MPTVVVTGATGFLGGYVVERFLQEDWQVRALGRNVKAGENLRAKGAEFFAGDLQDLDWLKARCQSADVVVHCAALSTVWGRWADFYQANVLGTRHVLQAAAESGVKRLVHISTPSLYTQPRDRLNLGPEDFDAGNRLNGYIRSKIQAEQVVQASREKLETVILRPRGLLGPGDTSLIPRLLEAQNKQGIPLFREGSNLVDLTCVENVAWACFLAATSSQAPGQVFNITNGEPRPFKAVLEQLFQQLGLTPRYLPARYPVLAALAAVLEGAWNLFGLKGEPPLTRYTVMTLAFSQTLDLSAARTVLGYKPVLSLDEGLANYARWYHENN